MAYIAAEYYSKLEISEELNRKVMMHLDMQGGELNRPKVLFEELKKGIKKGEKKYGAIETSEQKWSIENKDLNAEFAKTFYDTVDIIEDKKVKQAKLKTKTNYYVYGLVILILLFDLLFVFKKKN